MAAMLHLAAAGDHVSMPMKKAHQVLNRRPLWASNGNSSNIPMGGSTWPTAIFWVEISVGTPPVYFPVAVDSGSGDLDIEGAGCDGCPTIAPNNGYDPTASSTSSPVSPYNFSNTYQTCDLSDPTAPCTISGNLYSDKVSMGGRGPVDIDLGAITKQTSNFDQFAEVCGVMGFLGSGKRSVFPQLVQAGFYDNVWAMCLHEGSTSNGTLTLGGIDPQLYTGDIQYTPIVNTGYYSVNLNEITVAGTGLGVTQVAILDTGTNVLLLPDEAYSSMKTKFLKDCDQGKAYRGVCDQPADQTIFDDLCFELTAADIAAYPDITLELSGEQGVVELAMTPSQYLLLGDKRAKSATQSCLGVRPTGKGGFLIIGDTTMQNYYLIFDNAQERIGWAPVNTDNCGSL